MIPKAAALIKPFIWLFNFLSPVGDLLARIWVAQIFFFSGIVKMQAWQSTKMLFAHVYNVPLLPSYIAAILGTGAELILPIFLVLGLGGRFMIFIFFCYNAICAISYPYLWTSQGAAGLSQHANWALLLMLLMFHGSGKLSLDYLIHKLHGHHFTKSTKKS